MTARVYLPETTLRQVWCDRCLTSAGYVVTFHVLSEENGEPVVGELGTARGCARCDLSE